MYKIAKPLFLHCQSPLHAGSGSDLGIVDLPIQRERHTSFPKIESSSLKGALREAEEYKAVIKIQDNSTEKAFENLVKLNRVFGFDDADVGKFSKKKLLDDGFTVEKNGEKKVHKDFAGAIGFTDARLLLFPIKSMKGVFAWATCERVLRQFESDMKLTEGNIELNFSQLDVSESNALVSTKSNLVIGSSSKVVLEEYAFTVSKNTFVDELGKWLADTVFKGANSYIKKKIQEDIVILSDDDFKDFVNLSTEVITRIKIDNETGTVADGALFTEEYLPAESILYSLVLISDEFSGRDDRMTKDKVQAFFKENLPNQIQVGGNATLGKGLIRTHFNPTSHE
jgi:CRISPR-associated protein Cmr4